MNEIISNTDTLIAIANALNGIKDILWWIALWSFLSLFFNK